MNLPFSKSRRIGNTLYLSGEIGFGADGTVPDGIEAQTRNCLDRIKATLESEGLTMASVVSATCYLTDASDFAAFNEAYPGSPLAARALLGRGRALDGLGDTREAARAYLSAFTSDDSGPTAPEALYELGAALGRLGQVDQACVTLGEVGLRFPQAEAVALARQEMAALGCS